MDFIHIIKSIYMLAECQRNVFMCPNPFKWDIQARHVYDRNSAAASNHATSWRPSLHRVWRHPLLKK